MNYEKFKAGAGCGEICFPDEMFPTDGFAAVHDNPHIRVLVLDCGQRAAIVSMELVNAPEDGVEAVKEIIAKKTGTPYENIWAHVTHAITTPHAPRDPSIPFGSPEGVPPKEKPEGSPTFVVDSDAPMKRMLFISAMLSAAEKAAADAAASFGDAVLRIGTGYCDVNVNRDVETPLGWWIGHNPDGLSNKTATVLRAETPEGKPIGMLINYGLKPCAIDNSEMDRGTRLVSSDVPGYACTMLEQRYGAPVLFTMSAAGDQVPKEQAWYYEIDADGTMRGIDLGVKKGLEIVTRLGKQMTEEIAEIADSAKHCERTPALKLGATSVMCRTKARNEMKPTLIAEYVPDDNERELDAHVIALGDLAFVAIKPEVNAATEAELKAASPYAHTLLISMVNGGMKYLPERSAYERVTWEALSSTVMPGAAEAWVEETGKLLADMKSDKSPPRVTAVAEPRSDGQRICKAVLDFEQAPADVEKITVKGRTIIGRKTCGNTVTLTLDEDEDAAFVIPRQKRPEGGGFPKQAPGSKRPPMPVRKRSRISLAVKMPGWAGECLSEKVAQPVVDDFIQGEYKGIPYNLFTPKKLALREEYPLVVFIPDASANGPDPLLALAQGIGGTIWATPEWQTEHPCFVLAVQVPNSVHLTNNEHTCSPELEIIKELIDKQLAENAVDLSRIYATGQSQGCMAFCELNLRYPEYFAASMLLSGHWDVEKMTTLTKKPFVFGLSEGGLKEYPCFNAITDGLEDNGVKVTRVRLSFRDGWEVNEKKVSDAQCGEQVLYIIFDKDTAFPDNGKEIPMIAHHSRGWELCYQLKAAREWIFRQHI